MIKFLNFYLKMKKDKSHIFHVPQYEKDCSFSREFRLALTQFLEIGQLYEFHFSNGNIDRYTLEDVTTSPRNIIFNLREKLSTSYECRDIDKIIALDADDLKTRKETVISEVASPPTPVDNIAIECEDDISLPLTFRAKKVLQHAKLEARGFNHSNVGTEHLLLGLIKEGSGIAAYSLREHGIELDKVRAAVKRLIPSSPFPLTYSTHPLTLRSLRLLEEAANEAKRLTHRYIGTEHILLAMLGNLQCVGHQILKELGGLSLVSIKADVESLLNFSEPSNITSTDHVDFINAMKMAHEGHHVRRLSWENNDYIYVSGNFYVDSHDHKRYVPTHRDVLATDWIILPKLIPKSLTWDEALKVVNSGGFIRRVGWPSDLILLLDNSDNYRFVHLLDNFKKREDSHCFKRDDFMAVDWEELPNQFE